MMFRKSAGQAPSRAQILKRGLIGIAAVLVLAFLASFLGGGSDQGAPSGQAQQKGQAGEQEEEAIDAKSLLGAEPDAPASGEPQRVPASRKFDYSAGMDDGGEDQDAAMQPPSGTAPADEPITPAAPEAQQGSSAAPAGDGGQDEAVPVLDAPEPAPAPSPAAKSPEAAPSTAQSQSPAPAAAPAPAPAAAPASAAANAAAAGGNKDQAHDGAAKDGGAVLYCGSFASSHAAEEQKALLAFQGQRAFVVRRGSSYTLKMGPYKTKAAARAEFSKLDQAGLVSECALEDN